MLQKLLKTKPYIFIFHYSIKRIEPTKSHSEKGEKDKDAFSLLGSSNAAILSVQTKYYSKNIVLQTFSNVD